MNRHFVSDFLPILLGALVPRATKPAPPEYKQLGTDLYAHRETGLMRFTPPPPAGMDPKVDDPRPKNAVGSGGVVWHKTPPPKVNWYKTKDDSDPDTWFRHWDGKTWSYAVSADKSAVSAKEHIHMRRTSDYRPSWCDVRPPWEASAPAKIDTETWHDGAPPAVGWWNASTQRRSTMFRYWNGKCWSYSVEKSYSCETRARLKSKPFTEGRILWRFPQMTDWE